MSNDAQLPESEADTEATSTQVSKQALEEEFETIQSEFQQWLENLKIPEARVDEMFAQFSRRNPAYSPVLNGHLLIEGLLDQLLFESLRNPKCLRDSYSFAEKLNILQSVSPLASTSLLWKLLTKLNTLRNVVAHGSEPKKLLKLLREIQVIIRTSKLRTDKEMNQPDWIISYAFAMASIDLDLLIATARMRNRVQRLWERLEIENPLALKTFRLLGLLDTAATHSLV